MEQVLKISAAVLLTVILNLAVGKYGKEFSVLLTLLVCAMAGIVGLYLLQPVIDFLRNLAQLGQFDHAMVRILLKVTGIALISEIVCLVCTDSGNAALGKCAQIAASAAILYLSLPMLQELLELVQKILGEL